MYKSWLNLENLILVYSVPGSTWSHVRILSYCYPVESWSHWNLFGEEICKAVTVPEGFCDSTIVLILKITNPVHLKNFRPISLCNVLYKIASKVLVNHLKLILHMVISENQSAFAPGRLITDNALIVYECLHSIRQQHAKRPFFALK
jgi:hypothetical protein